MRSIKIKENPQSKVIEDTRSDDHGDTISIKSNKVEENIKVKSYDPWEDKKDANYQRVFNFPSKYHYFIFLIMFQNSNDMIPIAVRHSLTFSGGGFLLQLIAVGVLIVFPLMYVEMFLGSYAQRTNSQIYKMAPIFFGLTFLIWIYTIVVVVVSTVEEAVVLAHFIKRLSLSGEYNLTCPSDDATCYDFRIKPNLKDKNCHYNYISMECDSIGEIRYLTEYHYWNSFKRRDTSIEFPRWEIVVAIIIEWSFITFAVTRGLTVLVKMHNFGFIFRTIIFAVILITALTKEGCGYGIHKVFHVATNEMNLNEILGMLAFVMFRCGLIFPVGYMTYSSCLPQRKSMRSESVVICTGGLLATMFYLMCIFGVMGVISTFMGVDLSAVYVPYRGIFLVIIPEFLLHYNNATIFAVCYYFAVIFPETIRYAIHIHMWILNLYDMVPKYRKHHVYVCLIVCGFYCLLNMIGVYKPLHTVVIPAYYSVHTTIGTMVFLALQMSMICYVYGVSRLTDDIHFLVGYKPNKAGQYVWATFPIVLYVSFFFLRFRNGRISIERDMPPEEEAEYVVNILNNVQIGMLIVTALLSLSYVLSKMGAEYSLLSFFKVHYTWGPAERDERIKRKRFKPRKAIRSQPAPMRVTKLQEKQERHHMPLPEQEELEEQKEQILKSRIFSDSKFFMCIGVSPDKIRTLTTSTIQKVAEPKSEID